VGSANLDRMGMGGAAQTGVLYRASSEIGILVKGHDQALALRNLLAAEHLGTDSPPDDFDDLFDKFYQCALTNGQPEPPLLDKDLNGQLVFHRANPLSIQILGS
jgi:hypothetical protein